MKISNASVVARVIDTARYPLSEPGGIGWCALVAVCGGF